MNEHGLVNIYLFMVTYLLAPDANDYENAGQTISPQHSGTDDELEMSEITVSKKKNKHGRDEENDEEADDHVRNANTERNFFNKKVLNRKD